MSRDFVQRHLFLTLPCIPGYGLATRVAITKGSQVVVTVAPVMFATLFQALHPVTPLTLTWMVSSVTHIVQVNNVERFNSPAARWLGRGVLNSGSLAFNPCLSGTFLFFHISGDTPSSIQAA